MSQLTPSHFLTSVLISSILLLCIISCQEDVPLIDLDIVSEIVVNDNGNEGNGSDIEVNFRKQPNSEDVGRYRVFVLKDNGSTSFDVNAALDVNQPAYIEAQASDVFPLRGIKLSSQTTDVDGELINENTSYRIAVASLPKNEETHSAVLNIATSNFQLSVNNQVNDQSREMSAGAGSLIVDNEDNLIMADYNIIEDLSNTPGRVSQMQLIRPDGQTIAFKNELPLLGGNFYDQKGNFYQSILANGEILKIDSEGNQTFIEIDSRGFENPDGLYVDESDNIFVVDSDIGKLIKIDPNGETLEIADVSGNPRGITRDDEGNFYVSMNNEDGRIVKIDPFGNTTTFAHVPTFVPPSYQLEFIMWVGYIQYFENNLYVAGMSTDKIYKIDMAGNVSVFAGSGTRLLPRGGANTAHFNRPIGLAFSNDGSQLFVSGCLDIAPQHTQASSPSKVYAIELLEE